MRTLRNGLPRFVVFIMCDEVDCCCCCCCCCSWAAVEASEGIEAGERVEEEEWTVPDGVEEEEEARRRK